MGIDGPSSDYKGSKPAAKKCQGPLISRAFEPLPHRKCLRVIELLYEHGSYLWWKGKAIHDLIPGFLVNTIANNVKVLDEGAELS